MKFLQCVNPLCDLRMPIDLDHFSGKFCPRCGAEMVVAAACHPSPGTAEGKNQPTRALAVLLDNVRSAYNVGSIFRTADGVGIEKLFLCGITPNPHDNEPEIFKTALGAEIELPWEYHPNGLTLARKLKDDGHRLVGLERTGRSRSITTYHAEPLGDHMMVLIVGNEKAGVDPGLLPLCDVVLALPMLGRKASLNVATAFAVAAYWLSFN
jgi:tRNA G18 (ribose-2'-O)-methylase SpoU